MFNYYQQLLKNEGILPKNYDGNQVELACVDLDASHINYSGIPLKVLSQNKIFVPKQLTNGLVIGNTGSGKTTAMSVIYALLNMKAGNNMVITDTKGSIYSLTSNYAKELGYEEVVINLSEKTNSNHYNPLALPYQLYKSNDKMDQEKGLELMNEFIQSLVEKHVDDMFWEYGAISTLIGECYIDFDLAKDESQATIENIFNIHYTGSQKINNLPYLYELMKLRYSDNTVVKSNLSTYVTGPNDTRGSFDAVINQKLSTFLRNESLLDLISSNDVDFEKLASPDTKYIIYIILPDFSSLYHSIAGTLVKQCIVYLEKKADNEYNGSLPKKVAFLLEEAGQYKINDLSQIVSTSRSRNMEFCVVVQSFAQLFSMYGKDDGKNIIENLIWIYLYAKDNETLKTISSMGGYNYSYTKEGYKTREAKISINDLLTLPKNQSVIVFNRKKACLSSYVPYYQMNLQLKLASPKREITYNKKAPLIDIKEIVSMQRQEHIRNIMRS